MVKKVLILTALFMTLYSSNAQETSIRGFSDVKLSSTNGGDKRTSFALGQYDMYITSQLNDDFSILGETVFEYDGDQAILDIERVIAKYSMDNYFNIEFGKHHSPIGYWNTQYHHGAVLQPTIERPQIFRFEDEGGILPIHSTGIMFAGYDITDLKLAYSVMIANGLGSSPVKDNDNYKATIFNLSLKPIEGVQIGVSYTDDQKSAKTATLIKDPTPVNENQEYTLLTDDMKQNIITGTFIYQSESLEVISEFAQISNKVKSEKTTTTGFYAYAGYKIDKFVPYLRYDQVKYDTKDVYYPAIDITNITVGLRYEINYLSVLKAEYRNWDIANTKSNEFVFQFAFGY